jgi:hypothetical protein
VIPIFILLSQVLAFISNAILEGKRSFNPPSTTSRLILARSLSCFYHHPHPRHFESHPTTRRNTATTPSPHLRDVGSTTNAPSNADRRIQVTPAPPLSIGMWAARCCSIEVLERRNMKGGPMKWEAHAVCPENEPQPSLWFVFVFFSSPTLH